MVAALYSNPNWDDEANDRASHVKDLNKSYNHAIEVIYDPSLAKEKDIDWDKPFWQAAKRSLERTREKFGLANKDLSMRDVIDAEAEEIEKFKQLERRAEMRAKVDQLKAD